MVQYHSSLFKEGEHSISAELLQQYLENKIVIVVIIECSCSGSKLIYELLPEKKVAYVLHIIITSILGRLPVVLPRDTGTISLKCRTTWSCLNGAHQYDSTPTKADASPCDPWQSTKRSRGSAIACIIAYYDPLCRWCIHYFTLLHLMRFDISACYYMLS